MAQQCTRRRGLPAFSVFAHVHDPDMGLDRVALATTASLDEYPALRLSGPDLADTYFAKVHPYQAQAILTLLDDAPGDAEEDYDLAALRESLAPIANLAGVRR